MVYIDWSELEKKSGVFVRRPESYDLQRVLIFMLARTPTERYNRPAEYCELAWPQVRLIFALSLEHTVYVAGASFNLKVWSSLYERS